MRIPIDERPNTCFHFAIYQKVTQSAWLLLPSSTVPIPGVQFHRCPPIYLGINPYLTAVHPSVKLKCNYVVILVQNRVYQTLLLSGLSVICCTHSILIMLVFPLLITFISSSESVHVYKHCVVMDHSLSCSRHLTQ